jgi:hypothetical protein
MRGCYRIHYRVDVWKREMNDLQRKKGLEGCIVCKPLHAMPRGWRDKYCGHICKRSGVVQGLKELGPSVIIVQ